MKSKLEKVIRRFKEVSGPFGFNEAVADLWTHFMKFLLKGHRHYARFSDYPYPICQRLGTSDDRVFEQVFGDRQYACMDDTANVKVIMDCGANIGLASLYFLNRFPEAFVVAIEPDGGNFKICKLNLKPYRHRTRLLHSGVWSHQTGLKVLRGLYGDGREWATQVSEIRDGEMPDIMGMDIGSVSKDLSLDRIDILKIDIERSEVEVFSKNYENWLCKVRNLVIELHDKECENVFFRALSNYDYQLTRAGELTICKNLSLKQKP